MARRRKKPQPPAGAYDTQAMENALWLMGLARRPGTILRLELDSFPIDYIPRARA